jgi:hypothetical protein
MRRVRAGTLLWLAASALPARADEAKAVAALEKAGAKLERDEKAPGRPVVRVDFRGKRVPPEDLACLQALPRLRVLHLGGSRVTEEGLAKLAAVTGLRELGLDAEGVTDRGLAHLKGLRELEIVDAVGLEVTDEGLKNRFIRLLCG